jgi:hypothetical protein
MFPGFDTDIHGLVEEERDGKMRYYVDCVRSKRSTKADSNTTNIRHSDSDQNADVLEVETISR